MIFFKPEVLDETNAEFKALDGDKCLGFCRLFFGAPTADVYNLTLYSNDDTIGEGLLRAAFNFAGNKGIYMGSCSAPQAKNIASSMNFEFKNGLYINDIPSILMGSCCKFDK